VIAAFNASSWCGKYKPYKEVEKAAKSCGYSKKSGIYFFQFAQLMNILDLPVKLVRPKSMEEIESRIYLGKFFIFFYVPAGYTVGHVVTAFLDHKGRIKVINPDEERATWDDLAADIHAHGMQEFHLYEIPHRQFVRGMASRNDEFRAT
jgi:hypothetical protein